MAKIYGALEKASLEVIADVPSLPAIGVTGRVVFVNSVKLAYIDNGTLWVPLGSSAGGGGGANWLEGAVAPLPDVENGEKVWLFSDDGSGTQELNLFVRVPAGYTAGNQIQMYLGAYSPSAANTFFLRTVSTLVRQGTDAITSLVNQRTSTNSALTNTVANQLRQVVLDLTDASGQVNGVAVSPGDILKVRLYRDATDTDTADIRFIPSATEVKFG